MKSDRISILLQWLGFFVYILMWSLTFVWAGNINAPSPMTGQTAEEQLYIHELYRNVHVLEVTTTSPDGNLKGTKGKIILYSNSGNSVWSIWANTDGNTTWQQLGGVYR